jgi:hypothetical protein
MNGLRIEARGVLKFPDALRPIFPHLERHYWLVDTQSGPFKITDRPNFPELEAELARYTVDVAQFEMSSCCLLRPPIFPQFVDLLVIDEWTYLVALPGPEALAIKIASDADSAGWLTQKFFGLIQSQKGTLLFHVDGGWELYTSNEALLEDVAKNGNTSMIDSSKWLEDKKNI